MKRFIKEVNSRICMFEGETCRQQKLGFAIAGVVAIILAILFFTSLDKVPATSEDYKELINKVEAIQEDPALLLKTKGSIIVKNENDITVRLENDDCAIIARYNNKFEIVETRKVDKSIHWLWIILPTLILLVAVWYLGYAMFTSIVLILELLCILIYEGVKRIKAILKKQQD